MQVKSKEKLFIYVFDDFAGDAFRHIVATGNRSVLSFLGRIACIA